MKQLTTIIFLLALGSVHAQDLTQGLLVNDLELRPMQELDKPAYLESYIDPSFGTTIRRITNSTLGQVVVPMYSTIQAWNADESLMIVYDQTVSGHQLLDGFTYEFIRYLDDVNPDDLEQIFWDFNDPNIFFYPDNNTKDFVKYHVGTQSKEVLFNMIDVSACNESIAMGNDVQMMSWDSDVLTFRCGNSSVYSYRISNANLTTFDITDVGYTAPVVGPSGNTFYHRTNSYDDNGNLIAQLNQNKTEHSCIGKFQNGNDGLFAVAFEQGPDGGCIGNLIAHDLVTGECIPFISEEQGYDYSKSGTHVSAVAHKNTDGAWLTASMIGFEEDGVALLDQELIIAKLDRNDIQICRIGHHRSDENEFDYWGEPHAVMSPTGTRVLYGSDWSGDEDGQSIDCYVVELPSYTGPSSLTNNIQQDINIFPNPSKGSVQLTTGLSNYTMDLYSIHGSLLQSFTSVNDFEEIKISAPVTGFYFLKIYVPGADAIHIEKLSIGF